jgi:hypothetical protein
MLKLANGLWPFGGEAARGHGPRVASQAKRSTTRRNGAALSGAFTLVPRAVPAARKAHVRRKKGPQAKYAPGVLRVLPHLGFLGPGGWGCWGMGQPPGRA